jgi:hypothetical protein
MKIFTRTNICGLMNNPDEVRFLNELMSSPLDVVYIKTKT